MDLGKAIQQGYQLKSMLPLERKFNLGGRGEKKIEEGGQKNLQNHLT